MGKLSCALKGPCIYSKGSVSIENCKSCNYLRGAIDIDDNLSQEIFHCPPDNEFETRSLTIGPGILNAVEKADRFNEGKPKWSLVHYESLVPMIRVLEYGCIKYAPFNWQKPMDTMEILESMQRHLAALFDGEIYDKESGVSHMGHIQCNAMFHNYHKQKENESK